jgi:hypothetical protein
MKNRLPGLAVMLALAVPLASEAQRDNPHRIPTNLPGVTAFAPPPAGFDPIKATDEELADWGFPPRPDQTLFPEEYANWVRVRTALKTRIIPHLVQTNIVHGPLQSAGDPESVENGSLKSLNWSGYVDVNDAKKYGSSSFTDIGTTIVVPPARQAFNACDGNWDYAWSSVAIDGYKTTEIAQAGVEFDAFCSGSSTSAYYSPFYEWYPSGQVRVTNLPILPGEDFFMAVHVESATSINVEIGNLTRGIFFGVDVTARQERKRLATPRNGLQNALAAARLRSYSITSRPTPIGARPLSQRRDPSLTQVAPPQKRSLCKTGRERISRCPRTWALRRLWFRKKDRLIRR